MKLPHHLQLELRRNGTEDKIRIQNWCRNNRVSLIPPERQPFSPSVWPWRFACRGSRDACHRTCAGQLAARKRFGDSPPTSSSRRPTEAPANECPLPRVRQRSSLVGQTCGTHGNIRSEIRRRQRFPALPQPFRCGASTLLQLFQQHL